MSTQLPQNRASNDVYDAVEMLVSLLIHCRDHMQTYDTIAEAPSCVKVITHVLDRVGLKNVPEWGSPEAWWYKVTEDDF